MLFRCARIKYCLFAAIAFGCAALSAEEGFVAMRTEGQLTYFKGTATLQGKVERRADPTTLELMGDRICFEALGPSKTLIPRSPDDGRTAWFCFDDHKEALNLLKLPRSPLKATCGYEAHATVRVTSYLLNREESEVTDLAKLVSVVARGPIRSIKCQ